MDLLVWRPGSHADGVCRVRGLQNVDDVFELGMGVSRSSGWPNDAFCRMDPFYPKDIALADSLLGANVLLVSSRVKDFLGGARVNNVELLPVQIVNHKGRTASRDYFVVNPLDVCDCIDEQQSLAERNPIDPDSILGSARLALRYDRIPAELKIFRPEFWREIVLIRRELADAMRAAGLTGLRLIEPDDYTGLI